MQQHCLLSLPLFLSHSSYLFLSLPLYSCFKFDITFCIVCICCTKSLFRSGRNSGYSTLTPSLSTSSSTIRTLSLPPSLCLLSAYCLMASLASKGHTESERKLKFSALFAQLFVNNSVLSLAFGLIIFTVRANCKFAKVISPIPSLSHTISLSI